MGTAERREWVLTQVSLDIKGRELQPEEVTSFLGIEPTGVRNPGPPGKWELPGTVEGMWGIDCNERTSRDFHEQLSHILSIMESKQPELAQLVEQGHEVILDIYGFAGNDCTLALRPEEIKRIALLGFPLRVAANMNER
ncbi:DUF4279 domain-containing protein [Streptomyces sp. NPDC001153]